MKRRDFLAWSAGAVGLGCGLARVQSAWAEEGSMAVKESDLKCLPVISGNLRPYDHGLTQREGKAGWARELDDERALGFDLLWLSHLQPALDDTSGDPLRDILDLCAERNMEVILDVGSTGNWYKKLELEKELAQAKGAIQALAERYGDHPAFFAWYIPHEIYQTWDDFAEYIEALYKGITDDCKAALPDKPVTLSPFFILDDKQIFGQYRYPTPAEYEEYWTRLIAHSGIDIIMLQDSGEHFSYVTMEQRRPFFEAMARACRDGGARFWGNVEVAEYVCPSIEEFVNRYGRVHHSTVKDLPWRPVPMDRLEQKLRLAASFCERLVSWGYVQFGRPQLSAEAKAWYDAYREYARKVREETP